MKKLALVALIAALSIVAVAAPGDARDRHHGGVVFGPSVTFGFSTYPYASPYPAYSYPDPYWYGYTPRYYPPYAYSPYAYAPAPYCPSLGVDTYSCPEWRQSP